MVRITTKPEGFIMNWNEANDRGKDRGIECAMYIDLPKIGDRIDKYDLPNFKGLIKTLEDCKEVFLESAAESETHSRQFTPFEFTASEINGHEEFEAAELWEAFDEGIIEGIGETWDKRSSYYNDTPVVVLSHIGIGWDIEIVPSDPKKIAYGDTGQSAYDKARILAEFYRDINGQIAEIIWLHKFDVDGTIVEA
jgi:hypothetical protein